MPFHFVTVEDESSRHGSIHEGSDRQQLEESVRVRNEGASYCSSRVLDGDYDGLLRHAVHGKDGEHILRIQKGSLVALTANLRQDGKIFADSMAMHLPPFEKVSRYLPDGPDLKVQQGDARCLADHAMVSFSPSALYRHCVNALETGVASRIEETNGYPYYFVSAQHTEGTIVDLVVRAHKQADIRSALQERGASLRELFVHRLAPPIQAACAVSDTLSGSDDEGGQGGCGRGPEATMRFTRESFERWITRIHTEGQRIFELHADAYPTQSPEHVPDGMDVRQGESDAWERAVRYMEGGGTIELRAAEIKEIILDLLSHGCADHD